MIEADAVGLGGNQRSAVNFGVHPKHQFAAGRFEGLFAASGAVFDIKIDGLVKVVGQLFHGLAFKTDAGVVG